MVSYVRLYQWPKPRGHRAHTKSRGCIPRLSIVDKSRTQPAKYRTHTVRTNSPHFQTCTARTTNHQNITTTMMTTTTKSENASKTLTPSQTCMEYTKPQTSKPPTSIEPPHYRQDVVQSISLTHPNGVSEEHSEWRQKDRENDLNESSGTHGSLWSSALPWNGTLLSLSLHKVRKDITDGFEAPVSACLCVCLSMSMSAEDGVRLKLYAKWAAGRLPTTLFCDFARDLRIKSTCDLRKQLRKSRHVYQLDLVNPLSTTVHGTFRVGNWSVVRVGIFRPTTEPAHESKKRISTLGLIFGSAERWTTRGA